MSRVFYARKIQWEDADGKHEQFGIPAMVRCSVNCRNYSDRRRMMYVAKLCGVRLVPIQFGNELKNGEHAVVVWLALGGGSDAEIASMETFLKFGLVTWEHCIADKIPCAIDLTTLGNKKKAQPPAGKPLPYGEKPNPMRNVSNDVWKEWAGVK